MVVGGQGDNDCLIWAKGNQISDAASVELLNSPNGGARLILNGFFEKFDNLKMDRDTKILTGGSGGTGGVLTVLSTLAFLGVAIANVANFAAQMTGQTDVSGSTSGTGFGPYLQSVPNNPFTNTNTVGSGASGSSAWYTDGAGTFRANDTAAHAAY